MPTIIGNIKKLIRSKLRNSKENRSNLNTADEKAELNAVFRFKYTLFKELLAANSELLNILSDMEEKLKGEHIFGSSYIKSQANRSLMHSFKMVKNLNVLSGGRYPKLYEVLGNINQNIKAVINEKKESEPPFHVIPYSNIFKKDADWVGGKNANLGEIQNCLNIPVPEGFAITTRAFNHFLDHNNLREEIMNRKNLIGDDEDNVSHPENAVNTEGVNDLALLNRLSEEVMELIQSKLIPYDMMADIISSCETIWADSPDIRLAMRSSAIGEDGDLSFAGQYLTLLNVRPEHIGEAYKSIIASLYTARSIFYRISKGIYDDDLAMAVACIRMVDSVASGVMYTRHPYNIVDENIIINAVWGLGPYAVDGIIRPDTYVVEKGNFPKDDFVLILSRQISDKKVQLVCNNDLNNGNITNNDDNLSDNHVSSSQNKANVEARDNTIEGGVKEIPVPLEKQSAPCLTDDQIKQLAHYGMQLEEHYKCAQDVEWALDNTGKIMILQSRPLKIKAVPHKSALNRSSLASLAGGGVDRISLKAAPISGYKILINQSEVASQGAGTGKAFHVASQDDLAAFPKGAVLIARHSSPEYVVVMKLCSGIITESGSVSGHMAALAREFNVPTLMGLGAQDVLNLIPDGMEITVDGYAGRVYEGVVTELLSAVEKKDAHMKGTPVHDHLTKVAELMTPLYLINPKAPEFSPSGCKTLHDIARFCHENSYTEMFNVSDIASKRHKCSFRLSVSLPIDLHVIDLGGGIRSGFISRNAEYGYDNTYNERLSIDEISSVPFLALLKGMLSREVHGVEPRPVSFSGLFSVMQEQMLSPGHGGGERFGDRSYAIIADKYLNFSSRVGYHYSVVDAYCGETINKNYITFSFKGGAADDIRKNRRVRAIALILEQIDFTVAVKEDKVDARLQKYPCSFIQNRLDTLGKLLIFTRQMDMLMTTEKSIKWVADNFLSGNYKFC
ncbi:MAG: phosphoenolpyruvate synthase [Desulfamplus sp.]|nr:phosphoenolpyruvate synthase [Desulfamplus sp.]